MRALTHQGLFGWLHGPAADTRDTGVLLVGALGRDARCTHAPLRLFADELAAAGYPVLRYDHRGEGDSAPLADPGGDALAVWLADLGAMAARLRQLAGVRRVVVAGVRIGATLAVLRADMADGLILLAPVLSGRSWLQKMRFSGGGAPDEGIDSSGLHLAPATAASLAGIDLNRKPPARPAFLAAQNRLGEGFGARLAAHGVPVQVQGFPGYEALFQDAHSNAAPLEVFRAARMWLEDRFGTLEPPVAAPDAPGADAPTEDARLELGAGTETAVTFGADLQGVLSLPETGSRDGRAVLFCNTGGDPRAGIGGFATGAARALAARGVASLRFDFAGLGDSLPPPGEVAGHIYETGREADLDAAVALLMRRSGACEVAVAGVCSGAHHALKAVVRDPRIAGVFAISPVKIVWRPGDSLAFGKRDTGKSTGSYLGALRDMRTYRRLLSGGVDVATVARTLWSRLASRGRSLVERAGGRTPLAGLRQASARGARVHLLMGVNDSSVDEVETWFGAKGARLARLPGMSLDVDPRLDHGLARRLSREVALSALLAWLGLEAAPADQPASTRAPPSSTP